MENFGPGEDRGEIVAWARSPKDVFVGQLTAGAEKTGADVGLLIRGMILMNIRGDDVQAFAGSPQWAKIAVIERLGVEIELGEYLPAEVLQKVSEFKAKVEKLPWETKADMEAAKNLWKAELKDWIIRKLAEKKEWRDAINYYTSHELKYLAYPERE